MDFQGIKGHFKRLGKFYVILSGGYFIILTIMQTVTHISNKKVANKWGVDMAYGGLGDSSGMRHVSRSGSFFHADSSATWITADQVCPSTTAHHCLLSNSPLYHILVSSPHFCIARLLAIFETSKVPRLWETLKLRTNCNNSLTKVNRVCRKLNQTKFN